MAKNIIVYSDGTGQDGGVRVEQRISNVYKLYHATRVHPDNAIDPDEQVCFYDPGLGTDIGATGITKSVRTLQKLLASVTGRGITTNITDCYEFIINHYQDGDRIFLIGFSRGAYTVRSLANLLMLCGVPIKAPDGPLLRFRKQIRDIADEAVSTVLEHGAGHGRADYEAERFEMSRRFCEKYGSAKADGSGESNAAAHFIGVFDTVAALGAKGFRRIATQLLLLAMFSIGAAIPLFVVSALLAGLIKLFEAVPFWSSTLLLTAALVAAGNVLFWLRQRRSYRKEIRDFPNKGDYSFHYAEWKSQNFDRLLSMHVKYARSANAIDETRADFDRVAWGSKGQDQILAQNWFAGNHSDIGGSYPEAESRLSDIALQWMIEEAVKVPEGLKIGPVTSNGKKLDGTGDAGTPLHLFPSFAGVQHSEIAGTADTIARYTSWLPTRAQKSAAMLNYKTKIRTILPEARLHPTVLERFKMPEAPRSDGVGPYRPEALREHSDCKQYYLAKTKADESSPAQIAESVL